MPRHEVQRRAVGRLDAVTRDRAPGHGRHVRP
jgi:hypothetical protein